MSIRLKEMEMPCTTCGHNKLWHGQALQRFSSKCEKTLPSGDVCGCPHFTIRKTYDQAAAVLKRVGYELYDAGRTIDQAEEMMRAVKAAENVQVAMLINDESQLPYEVWYKGRPGMVRYKSRPWGNPAIPICQACGHGVTDHSTRGWRSKAGASYAKCRGERKAGLCPEGRGACQCLLSRSEVKEFAGNPARRDPSMENPHRGRLTKSDMVRYVRRGTGNRFDYTKGMSKRPLKYVYGAVRKAVKAARANPPAVIGGGPVELVSTQDRQVIPNGKVLGLSGGRVLIVGGDVPRGRLKEIWYHNRAKAQRLGMRDLSVPWKHDVKSVTVFCQKVSNGVVLSADKPLWGMR